MTIDSSWIACLKEEVPTAFTPEAPFVPSAIFCDGQIRLMPSAIDSVISWEEYIQRQFERYLKRYFERGVPCVILAFDDYAHVPAAKNMTQSKRRKNVPSLDFNARDCLPPCVPRGEDFTRCISNRTFKSKIIQLVIHRLTVNMPCKAGQSLIVDYTGAPVRYSPGKPPEALEGFVALGEADVKFVRYAELFDRLQVDSVDGDSIPIAMLQMERGHAGRVSIYRLQTRVTEKKKAIAGTGANRPANSKRSRPGSASSSDHKPARVFEYVDVRLLYEWLVCMVVPQCLGNSAIASHTGHEVSMLVSMIGLSGTDFTRGLPLVSGKTLYEYLPKLWRRLARCYDPDHGQLVPDAALNLLVAGIYRRKFERHVPDANLKEILEALQKSKLSKLTKERLPSLETVFCTVQNINWLLRYWRELSPPDPVQPQFGFGRTRGGAVCFCA